MGDIVGLMVTLVMFLAIPWFCISLGGGRYFEYLAVAGVIIPGFIIAIICKVFGRKN